MMGANLQHHRLHRVLHPRVAVVQVNAQRPHHVLHLPRLKARRHSPKKLFERARCLHANRVITVVEALEQLRVQLALRLVIQG
jgi:hypothetical protein